jgi:membrane dipeptidase
VAGDLGRGRVKKLGTAATRRQLIAGAALMGASAMVNRGMFAVHAATTRQYPGRVVDLVRESLIIDMLAPLSLDERSEAWSGKLDAQQIADFRESGITAFHHSEGIVGPDAYQETLHYLAAWNGFVARNADLFSLVVGVDDIDRAKRQSRIAVIMGLQSADHFRKPDDVKEFHALGQRCAQLTYNTQNLIGSSCNDRACWSTSRIAANAPRSTPLPPRPDPSPTPMATAARSSTSAGTRATR